MKRRYGNWRSQVAHFEETMQTLWLILGSIVLPLVWGWAANRLLAWLWPENPSLAAARDDSEHLPDPLTDYQI